MVIVTYKLEVKKEFNEPVDDASTAKLLAGLLDKDHIRTFVIPTGTITIKTVEVTTT